MQAIDFLDKLLRYDHQDRLTAREAMVILFELIDYGFCVFQLNPKSPLVIFPLVLVFLFPSLVLIDYMAHVFDGFQEHPNFYFYFFCFLG